MKSTPTERRSTDKQNKRKNVVMIDNYDKKQCGVRQQKQKNVLGNRNYAMVVKYGKKIRIMRNSYLRSIRRNLSNNSLKCKMLSHSVALK